MADVFTPQKRKWIMSRVKGRDTKPERLVRSLVHRMGFRFRLHCGNLPGNPDIVLPRHKKIIFVHGCFWHGHEGCRRATLPETNTEFWRKKLSKNKKRDSRNLELLEKAGWKPLVVWGCEIKNLDALIHKLKNFLLEPEE